MNWKKHDYEDIPGTYVFDGKSAHSSYPVNKLFYSFNKEENRQEFADDPAAYCDKFGLSAEHKEMLLNSDFLGLLQSGTNVYYLAKLAIPSGMSVQDAGAAFHGITTEEFKQHLLDQSEGFQKKLEEAGGYWNG